MVAILEKFLERTRNEEVNTIFVLIKQADGKWVFDHGGAAWTTDMVGRLEIAKQEMIQRFIETL